MTEFGNILDIEAAQESEGKFGTFKVSTHIDLLEHKAPVLIEELQPGDSMHYYSVGAWSNINLLEKILSIHNPAEIYITSWAFGEYDARKLLNLKKAGLITKLCLLLDWRIQTRKPKVFAFLEQIADEMHKSNCHAKVTVVECGDVGISITGSANYTRNPRIEAGTVTNNKELAEFNKAWIIEAMKKEDGYK